MVYLFRTSRITDTFLNAYCTLRRKNGSQKNVARKVALYVSTYVYRVGRDSICQYELFVDAPFNHSRTGPRLSATKSDNNGQ